MGSCVLVEVMPPDDPAGQVVICYHGTGEIKPIADSFEELIEDHFYEW